MTTSNASNEGERFNALERLVRIAQGDTGQAGRVANFLLAWWNAKECGGFNLTDLWGLDECIVDDILKAMELITFNRNYPTFYGYEEQFKRIISVWRPETIS